MLITRVTRIAVPALVAGLAFAGLAACSSPTEEIAQNVAEQAVEGAMGGDVDISDNSMTMTDAEGNEMAVGEGVSVPASWPADVPLFDGELTMVTVQADGTAYAMWMIEDAPEAAADTYGAQLEGAGYALEQDANMGGTVIREYRSATMQVSVVSGEADGVASLSVTAVPQ